MRANCGFSELNVALTEYAFGGHPRRGAGRTDDPHLRRASARRSTRSSSPGSTTTSRLPLEEILALPEEESESMVTFIGGIFPVLPGTTHSTVLDLSAPGRYVAICFFPEGTTPEVFEQMMAAEAAAEGSIPDGSAPEGSAPMGTEPAEMTADTATMDTRLGARRGFGPGRRGRHATLHARHGPGVHRRLTPRTRITDGCLGDGTVP